MIKIDIIVAPPVLQTVLEIIRQMIAPLREGLACAAIVPVEDADMRQSWLAELQQSLQDDCQMLLNFMGDQRFGQEEIEIEEAKAEGVLRACSAVRLKVREKFLTGIADHELESGEVEPQELAPDKQRAYLCYLFLAGVQSFLIRQLDPDSAEF